MGNAILVGFRSSGGDMSAVSVVDPFMEVAAAVELGINSIYRCIDDLPDGIEFEIIVLAVKPQIFATFQKNWAGKLSNDGMVISIMAGVASDRIQASAGRACDVVRCMPNIAAAVGRSVNVAFTTNPARKSDFHLLFSGAVNGRVKRAKPLLESRRI